MGKQVLFVLLLVSFCSSVAIGGDVDGAGNRPERLVCDKGLSFYVSAPKGWILDNVSGIDQGLYAVFYPEGSSWEKSDVVMYVNTFARMKNDKVEDFIKEDIDKFKAEGPKNITVETTEPITTKDGKTAALRAFSGDRWGDYETVAYIVEENVFVMVILTSTDQGNYRKSLGPFRALVGSYHMKAR